MICVFATSLVLTVTIEALEGSDGDEIHLHPGGQGFWVARMVERLGEPVCLSAPVGGEAGKVISTLIADTSIELLATDRQDDSPVYVHDRRSGNRLEVAEQKDPGLSRHETDDLYSRTLEAAISAGTVVVTGRYGEGVVPESFFSRLGSDLASLEVSVVGDLHGPELGAFLENGELDFLKVSTDDLIEDGAIDGNTPDQIEMAVRSMLEKGVRAVVVSGGGESPTVARVGDQWYRVSQPTLEAADHRGSGDSMTAGLAVGLHRSLDPIETLRMAAAAGAANVVRRGLGSGDGDLAAALNESIEVERIGSLS